MPVEFDAWVDLVTSLGAMALVIIAVFYCLALWWERRRLYLLLGALALLMVLPLIFVRIVQIPRPPLLPVESIARITIVANGLTLLLGLAWLAALMRERHLATRILHESNHIDTPESAIGADSGAKK